MWVEKCPKPDVLRLGEGIICLGKRACLGEGEVCPGEPESMKVDTLVHLGKGILCLSKPEGLEAELLGAV